MPAKSPQMPCGQGMGRSCFHTKKKDGGTYIVNAQPSFRHSQEQEGCSQAWRCSHCHACQKFGGDRGVLGLDWLVTLALPQQKDGGHVAKMRLLVKTWLSCPACARPPAQRATARACQVCVGMDGWRGEVVCVSGDSLGQQEMGARSASGVNLGAVWRVFHGWCLVAEGSRG